MRKTVILLPAILVFVVGCDDEHSTEVAEDQYIEYKSTMDSLVHDANIASSYEDIPSKYRCIFELAWGLNHDVKKVDLLKEPHSILKDHYIDIAKAGVEVTVNALNANKLMGANGCFGAYQNYKLDSGMESIRKKCLADLKKGVYGDFTDVNFESYNSVQLYTTFSILNSDYLKQLPFTNVRLKDFLGSCAESK